MKNAPNALHTFASTNDCCEQRNTNKVIIWLIVLVSAIACRVCTFPIPIPRRLNLSSVFVYSTSHVLQHEPLSYTSICHCLHDKTIAFNLQNQPEPLQTVSHCSVSIYHTRPQSRRVVFFFLIECTLASVTHQCDKVEARVHSIRALRQQQPQQIIIKKIAACTHSIDTLGSVLAAQIFNVFYFSTHSSALCAVCLRLIV